MPREAFCLLFLFVLPTWCGMAVGPGNPSLIETAKLGYVSDTVMASCSTQECLPGLQVLGFGWDLVYGQSKPLQVVEYTFNKNATFQNPQNSSLSYLLPDQIGVVPYPSIESNSVTDVSYSASDIANSMLNQVSFGISCSCLGSFSASLSVTSGSSYLQQRSSYCSYTETTLLATIYQASLNPPYMLNPSENFRKAIDFLPSTYDEQAYASFIQYWGTHYLASSYFGGAGFQSAAIAAQTAQIHTSEELSIQAGIQFSFFQSSGSTKQSDSWFRGDNTSSSSFHTKMIGGDPSLAGNLSNWRSWVKSFYDLPVPVSSANLRFMAVPLSQFISDANKSANVQKAVDNYLASSPYPPPPPCQQEVYCKNQNHCCSRELPFCSGTGCAAGPQSCHSPLWPYSQEIEIDHGSHTNTLSCNFKPGSSVYFFAKSPTPDPDHFTVQLVDINGLDACQSLKGGCPAYFPWNTTFSGAAGKFMFRINCVNKYYPCIIDFNFQV